MVNLYGMERRDLGGLMAARGLPRYHGDQIYRWIYSRRHFDPESWTDLSKKLRADLAGAVEVRLGQIVDRTKAADGTVKHRIDLARGGSVESVYMVQSERITLCLSSQVGCALDCDFCLTGKMGFTRHLDAGEILGQVSLLHRERQIDGPFSIVFMGMGEPLHNYESVLAAFRILTDPDGFGMSRKRITVSTVGLAPAIERLAEEPLRPRLAVSLNATTDEVRNRLMPVNRKYPIARLLEAVSRFAETTNERFTFEYVLLAGINDSDADVGRLAAIARPFGCKINLIPFNAVPDWLTYRPTAKERVLSIRDRLLGMQNPASIRWSRGSEARAACGQLALLPVKR